MNIDTLVQQVRPIIRERGAQYYAENRIKATGAAQATIYRALVQGSGADAQYLVEIIYTPMGHVVSHCCTCPYEAEDLCKHQIALLLELRKQLQLELKERRMSGTANSKDEDRIYDTESLPGENLEKLLIHSLQSNSTLNKLLRSYVNSKQDRESEADHYESSTPYLDWLRPPAGDGFGDFGGE